MELYDIAQDPYEQKDLQRQHPEVVRQLLDQIQGWQATLPNSPQGAVFSAEREQ